MELQSKPRFNELSGSLPGSGAPEDERGATSSTLRLDAASSAWLREVAAASSIALEELLLAGYAALLFRLTGQDEVSILCSGVWFGKTARLTTFDFADQVSLREAISRRRSGAGRSNCGAGFLFTAHPVTMHSATAHPVTAHPVSAHEAPTSFKPLWSDVKVLLTVWEEGGQLALSLSSPNAEWREDTLESRLRYLGHLLNAAAPEFAVPELAVPEFTNGKLSTPVGRLALLESEEIRQIYAGLNDTAVRYEDDRPVHRRFAELAAASPESIAVVSGNQRLTYGELDRQSDDLAVRLVRMGAGRDRPVGICLERSTALSVGLLAVLKSGSCYVPLDPQHPPQRLAAILEECKPVAVIAETQCGHSIASKDIPVLLIDRLDQLDELNQLEVQAGTSGLKKCETTAPPDSLAYIIFTSGTTGKPKGVAVTHGSLSNLLAAMTSVPGMDSSDRLLALATISFDMAVVDMLLPLVTGATLVIADRSASADPLAIAQLLREQNITCMQATPTTWKMLTQSGWTGGRRLKALCGGEALPQDLCKALLGLVGQLWNCYGPTETTVWSSFLRLSHSPDDSIVETIGTSVPIGPPLANTTFYVMNEAGQPLPPGTPGELYIGGNGVAREYFKRAELTAERFVADPFSTRTEARLFRTGDLVRLLESGQLEFFGRLDHQVKLRGFRIELGEIEAVLRSHEAVADAVVLLRCEPEQEPRLVAYVVARTVARTGRPDPGDLRDYCALQLPAYMLPAEFVQLDRLPTTSTGKVDRKALPGLSPDLGERTAAIGAAPRDQLEARLLAIFRDVLRQPAIGTTDSFFDFGGYSLLSVKLFARINRALNLALPISLLFDAPTVTALAEVVRSGVRPPTIVPIRPHGTGTPIFIVHSYLLYAALPQIIDPSSPIFGIREHDGDYAQHSVEKRARLYASEILKVFPAGPFHLAGWCAAGSLTVEVARQLQASGHSVGLLALLDGERPGFDPRSSAAPPLRKRLGSSWSYHSGRLGPLPMSGKFSYLKEVFQQKMDVVLESFFARHFTFVTWLEARFRAVLPRSVFNNPWAQTAAVQDFSTRPYNGSITLFRATDVPHISQADETLGWREVALKGVEVVFVPGDHESMFKQPHLGTLGRKLSAAMGRGASDRPLSKLPA